MANIIDTVTIPLTGEFEGLARRLTLYDDGSYESALITLAEEGDNANNTEDT